MSVSRREFLKEASIGVALSSVVASSVEASTAKQRLHVLLFLEGGMDPLSVLVPRASRRYEIDRPTLAVPGRGLLTLNEQWGLHPALKSLHRCYAADRLRVLLSPTKIESSHMSAGMQLGRDYCGDPGESASPAIVAEPASLTSSWPASVRRYLSPVLAQSTSRAFYISMLAELMSQCTSGKLVVAVRDHDCHASAAAHLSLHLERLDAVFSALQEALEISGRSSDATLLVCSELGRSHVENARGGTDHGEFFLAMLAGAGACGVGVAEACSAYLA